jgi:hypothetical protein
VAAARAVKRGGARLRSVSEHSERVTPDRWAPGADDEHLRRLGLSVVIAEHCHGKVCIADPDTMTIYLSAEYDADVRSRAFARALDVLRAHLRRRSGVRLRLA